MGGNWGEGMIDDALNEVMAWASIFEHKLNVSELHRNLRFKITLEELEKHLSTDSKFKLKNGFVYLSKGQLNNSKFQQRQSLAAQHKEFTKPVLESLVSCKVISGLAITGSVAAGVNDEDGDLDVLIITKPNWVWRVRALAVYLGHRHPNGRLLCPNMVMSERSLDIEPSLYASRELMQILPIKDSGSISEFYSVNSWARDLLPNSSRKDSWKLEPKPIYPWWWKVMQLPILGRIIESWEAKRRIKQLRLNSKSKEAIYTKSVCRGHESSHKKRIEAELTKKLEAVK